MAPHSAVGVDNNLSSCKAGVALRTADDEPSGRIDVKLDVLGAQLFCDDRLDDLGHNRLAQLLGRNVFRMLSRHYNGLDSDRASVLVQHRNLRLPIGSNPLPFLRAAEFGEALSKPMRELDRHWHKLLCLIRRIPEHHSLVASPTRVNSLRNVWGLLVDRTDHSARL